MKIPCESNVCSGKIIFPPMSQDSVIPVTFFAIKGNTQLMTVRNISVTANS